MRPLCPSVWGCALLAVVIVGCRPAEPYQALTPGGLTPATHPDTRPEPSGVVPPTPAIPPAAYPPDYGWIIPEKTLTDVTMKFVAADSKDWGQFARFWNEPAPGQDVVQIKVPLGLDDPAGRIPAANPPTARKWALGKKLFFDPDWLSSRERISCADCHLPARGYARNPERGGSMDGYDTPVLINTLYNSHQFWDGRVRSLEEVVQRSLDDNRDSPERVVRQHLWPGVVKRLRERSTMARDFKTVFGTEPTQDAIGKALATYLRTLLSGDSLHDLAVRDAKTARNDGHPNKAEYLKVLEGLDAAALKDLAAGDVTKQQAAETLETGERLFFGKAGCARCHAGGNYSDGDFHNIGVGASPVAPPPGKETGRFAALPIGLKDPRSIGAFKTPTLRSLTRSEPYFHDGSGKNLEDALRAHGGALTDDERKALIMFLKSLNGPILPDELADRTKTPPSATLGP